MPLSAALAVTPTGGGIEEPGKIGAAPPLPERFLFRLGEVPLAIGIGTVGMAFTAEKDVKYWESELN